MKPQETRMLVNAIMGDPEAILGATYNDAFVSEQE